MRRSNANANAECRDSRRFLDFSSLHFEFHCIHCSNDAVTRSRTTGLHVDRGRPTVEPRKLEPDAVFSRGHIGDRERRPPDRPAVEDDLGARGPGNDLQRPGPGGNLRIRRDPPSPEPVSSLAGLALARAGSAPRSQPGPAGSSGDGTIGSGSTRTGSGTADSLNGCPEAAPGVGVGVEGPCSVAAAALVRSPN